MPDTSPLVERRRQLAREACESILGGTTYNALRSAHTQLPKLMSLAAEQAFCDRRNDEHADELRIAMAHLEKHGTI